MDVSDRKHQLLAPGDNPSRAVWNTMIESVNDIVPVTDTTDRAVVAAAVGPTSARPLFVWRADAALGQELEVTEDGTNWRLASGTEYVAPTEVTYVAGFERYVDLSVEWNGVQYWRQGLVVTVSGAFTATTAKASGSTVFTLPARFRPPATIQAAPFSGSPINLVVMASGIVKITTAASSGSTTSFAATYVAAP